MSGSGLKANDNGKRGWARALIERFSGSGSNSSSSSSKIDTPPPYGPGEDVIAEKKAKDSCDKNSSTSPARIMGVNEYGQIIGYISPAYPTASWFNFQPVEKALILDVPIIDSKAGASSGSEESFRLRMRNPTDSALQGKFLFLGVQLHLALATNESWMLAACDEGKSGPIFKDRANMLRSTANAASEGKAPVYNPASSKVWSIHAIEGDCEELRLSWLDKDSAIVPLKATTEQSPKKEGGSHHFWARRKTFVLKSDKPIVGIGLVLSVY
ncbi:hypothetical protein FRB95_009374 [Tulasnella sp. JGI-2019a]|nr:hypothetical protein FRB95_009374 [Tulasnella sp. JGI-2019a]